MSCHNVKIFLSQKQKRKQTMYIQLHELHLFIHTMKPYIIGACMPVGIICFVLYYAWSQNEGNDNVIER